MAVSQSEPETSATAKKKVALVAGKPSHGLGQHEHRVRCMLLAAEPKQSGLPVETVVATNGWS